MPITCFVSYEIHPTTAGGCGVLIHHAAEKLLSDGHEVVLLLDLPADAFRRFNAADRLVFPDAARCRAYRVDDLCDNFPYSSSDVPCIFQYKSLRFAHALRKLLTLEPITNVEFFEYCGPGYYAFVERLFSHEPAPGTPVLSCRLHGSIEVLDRHGGGVVRDMERFLLHGIERRALSLAESVLVPTHAYYERYYRGLYSLEPSRTVVSPPPRQAFPRVTSRPSATGEFSIVFIGRLFHLKGVDQLVHAAVMLLKKRSDLRCVFEFVGYDSHEAPGGGSYAAYLRTLIPERLRDRFSFPGQLTHEAIAERLNRALFAVFPNLVESFCYALHEVYDAGVPVIVNDLPAFSDFFTHDDNALVYDGTTSGLLLAMERLIDDGPLRERITRPYPVATHPLGDFYDRPRALRPLAPAPAADGDPLVVVLCDGPLDAGMPAIASLREQTRTGVRTLYLVPAGPDGEETLWWLGRPWHVRDPDGTPIEASDVLTRSSLLVLRSGDRLHPDWFERCLTALARRPAMGFAGTWARSGGRVTASTLDIAPALYPFEHGAKLPRALLRTEAGVLLSDLLDPSLGALGLTGALWEAVGRWGHGHLFPEPLIECQPDESAIDPEYLKALVLRHGGPLAERLALLAALLSEPPGAPRPGRPPADVTVEHKLRVARELGGSALARMALHKLARRLMGRPDRRA